MDLQSSIQRYQDSLQYARSRLNFVIGEDLYRIPSDMNFRIGTYAGYNNILIATSDLFILGSNQDMNSAFPTGASTFVDTSIDDVNNLPRDDDDDVELDDDDVHREENNSLMLGIAFIGTAVD